MQDVGQGQVIREGRPIPKEVPNFGPEISQKDPKNGLHWVTQHESTQNRLSAVF